LNTGDDVDVDCISTDYKVKLKRNPTIGEYIYTVVTPKVLNCINMDTRKPFKNVIIQTLLSYYIHYIECQPHALFIQMS